MVDLRATNIKLRQRSERMLMELAGIGAEAARDALQRCGGRVKPAVLVARGLSPEQAEQALAAAEGSLRRALQSPGA